MREQLKPEGHQPLQPNAKAQHQPVAKQKLETSDGAAALTSKTDEATTDQKHDVSYEVFLEQVAHDMAYSDQLNTQQKQLLKKFGYQAEPSIDGPNGFEMRVFLPSNPEYSHPIIAFRGTEFTSLKDLQTDLAPKGVGYSQFQANQRRIEQALQRTSKHGRAWVTGHSLGGALAQLTAAKYSAQIARVITFQSPGIDAASVQALEQHNAKSKNDVESTHYQVKGDVVSTAGDRLTPGEVIQFDMQNSTASNAKTATAAMIGGILVGPATGAAASAANEAVAKHRAFPVSNAAEEHPAFKELFEEGKSFERIAGISKDTFQPRTPVSSDTFKPAKTSNFLRHTIGRTVFAIENASSNWGGDAKAREFAERNKQTIHTFSATTLLEHLNRLLDGWVSDDDLIAFETICYGIEDPSIMQEIRNQMQNRPEELHSDQQRQWVEDALNYVPKKNLKVQRSTDVQSQAEPTRITHSLGMGTALENTQRQKLEEFFGTSLETVKIHTDENAKQTTKNLGAHAATIGENILLSESANTRDDELIAHEVAHVIQQREARVPDGIDKDTNLETEAQNLGQAFVQGRANTKKKSAGKTTESKAVQRKVSAKTIGEGWTRAFSGKTGSTAVAMNLTRAEDGSLTGTYQMGAAESIVVEGKILKSTDNDLYLEGKDGSKWHGKYTEGNTLLFGNVVIGKKTIKNLELKASAVKPVEPTTDTVWQNRLFAAKLLGTEGDRRIDFTLDRSSTKISGSFAIHGTGRGNITKGNFDPNNKTSPLHLECTFTDGDYKGETRVMDGWFLYAEGSTKKDENNDGRDDSSQAALPLLIGGLWKGGKKDYKLEPVSPTASTKGQASSDSDKHWDDLERTVIAEIRKALKKAGKNVNQKDVESNVPIIVKACRDAGVTDAGQIAYILVTAGWESFMGMDGWMSENPSRNLQGSETPETYFESKYGYKTTKGLKELGNTRAGDGYKFRGRGYVQLTGRAHYQKWTKRLQDQNFKINGAVPDLVSNPELVATNKVLAAKILVEGMRDGLFIPANGGLANYISETKEDFAGARNTVNPGDSYSRSKIANAAKSLSNSLNDIGDEDKELTVTEINAIQKAEMRKLGMEAWGDEVGEVNGVKSFYNHNFWNEEGYRNTAKDGYDYGLKWHCVEFIRRYYHDVLGHDFSTKGHAHSYFSDTTPDGEKNAERGLVQFRNGSSMSPSVNDLLVFEKHSANSSVGHVAIVIDVSETSITVAQQNVGTAFTQSFAFRKAKNNSTWYLESSEAAILGWLRK